MPAPPLTPVGAMGSGLIPSDAPTLPGGYPSAPPPPAGVLAPGMAGMAAYGAPPTPPPAPAKRSRAKMIAIIAAILIVVLLAGLGVGLYFYLNSHTEADAATVLPGNTFAFESLDLVALAKNHPQFSNSSILSTASQQNGQQLFKQETGLDITSDVLPWIGRDIAVAGYAYGTVTLPYSGQTTPEVAAVVLIQSHDDNAARAAMTKAAKYQANQNGLILTTTTYSGVTLATLSNQDGPVVTLGAANGWAFITTADAKAAQPIVDRLNGKGDTLAKNTDFLRATKNLASDRFATTFVSLKGIEDLYNAQANVPFIATHPLAVGDMFWTNLGVRLQITLPSAQPASFGTLSGDTTSLAHLVPATALVYDGYANPSADIAAFNQLGGSTGDLAQQTIGVSSGNSAMQQPGAVVELPGQPDPTTGLPGGPESAYLLKAADPTTAQALLTEVATNEHFTVKPVKLTGAGTGMVTYAFYATTPGSYLGNDYGLDPSTFAPLTPPYVAGYAGDVNGTVVVTPSLDALSSIAATANGTTPSLGDSSNFQQLVAQAPSDAAGTAYINLSSIGSLASAFGAVTVSPTSTSSTAGGMLITQQLDANKLQFTVDEQINK